MNNVLLNEFAVVLQLVNCSNKELRTLQIAHRKTPRHLPEASFQQCI